MGERPMDEKREKKEPEVENTEKQKRTRMRSPRTMMMETILELTEMAKSPDLKPTKKVDALLQKEALVT
jgi:hypothetical protein